MFYSHNLLARKGPLGTVWCAAHLQNKLKKSNYITVNIPSTVEQIMNPQVPIALRMSGHLLLGVVRIYSKKVEYLQHDYNVLRIDISKVYTNADINLPEDANQAKFDSITLPDRFDLDLMDIDDYDPFGYALPSFLERNQFHFHDFEHRLTDTFDTPCPRTPSETFNGFQDPGPSHQIQSGDVFMNEFNIPSPEVIRDAVHMSPPRHSPLPDRVEPDPELVNEISNERSSAAPTMDDTVAPDGLFLPPQQTPSLGSTHSEPVNDNSDPLVLFEVAPTPAAEPEPAPAAEQPRAKRRKIKYDEATVLTNEFMEKSLKDPRNLLRKRKGSACSNLDIWRVNNNRKKEKVFFEPIITGRCDSLCELFDNAHMSKRAHEIHVEKDHFDDMEIEHQRENVGPSDVNVIPTYSPDSRSFSSPPQMDEYTPAMTSDVGSMSYPIQTTIGTNVGSTPDPTSSTGSFLSEMETPQTFFQDHHGFDNTAALSDIPEVDDAGELAFIEEDGGSPISLKGTPQSGSTSGKERSPLEIGSLQARTRLVAQYIKEKSTATSSTPQNAGSVSLNSFEEL
ncbi:hypothetical protein L1887_17906 [Cichorium endivia]|nr:hypothetical protein L1887_17906 [Cichorium endivia]